MRSETEREIKDDHQVSHKEKEKTGSEEDRHKGERNLLQKEWILLSHPQKKYFIFPKIIETNVI